jgi:putative ATPase
MEDHIEVAGTILMAVQGDLTTQPVAAIVNAANKHLTHGGGVAAAIVDAGGEIIQEESDRWIEEHGSLGDGDAAVTGAGVMAASWVIHVAGPIYQRGQDNEGMLRRAVESALESSAALQARSIAFPAISAGIFGYPQAEATGVIAATVATWIRTNPGRLSEIRLVGFDEACAADFQAAIDRAAGSFPAP